MGATLELIRRSAGGAALPAELEQFYRHYQPFASPTAIDWATEAPTFEEDGRYRCVPLACRGEWRAVARIDASGDYDVVGQWEGSVLNHGFDLASFYLTLTLQTYLS